MKSPYPIQLAHIERLSQLLNTQKAAFDGSDTGTGKTLCAVEVAKARGGPVFVVCPKAVIPAWQREFEGQQCRPHGILNYERIRAGNQSCGNWERRFAVYEFVWKLPKNTLIIFDEAHRAAGERTQNSDLVIAAKSQGYEVLLLSATLASSPTNLRAAGYVLGLHNLVNYRAFCSGLGCRPNAYKKMEFRGTKAHLAALSQKLAAVGSRMTVADMKDHFTETQILTEPLDFGDEIGRCYEEMEAELAELADRSKHDAKGAAANALVAQLRARQRVELLKTPFMRDFAQDGLDEGKSVVVFVNFTQTLKALHEHFEGSVVIWGEQTAEERQAAIDAFQTDKARVCIAQTKAGGVGVSLHDVTGTHPRLAIISPDWDEKAILQTMGRVHRAGGKTPSQQRVLFASGTIEADVEKSLRKKISNLQQLNSEVAGQLTPTTVDPTPAPQMITIQNANPLNEPETQPQTVEPAEVPTALEKSVESNVATVEKAEVPIAHGTRKHAEHSPSSLKMFEACPSFQKREGTNIMAEIGTKIHEAIEAKDFSTLEPEERVLAEFCTEFLDYIRSEKLSQGLKVIQSFDEVKLAIRLGGGESTFGSCDLLEIYSDGSAILLDWKTGYGDVEDAEINSQVWAYSLGAFQKFKISVLDSFLVMPRRGEVSHATFTSADQGKMQMRLGTIISRAKQLKGKEFNPTEGVCDYCNARGTCNALASKALVVAGKKGWEVPQDIDLASAEPEVKAQIYKLAAMMILWAEDTKKTIQAQCVDEGLELPGYRLDERRTPRLIDSPVGAWSVLQDEFSLDEYLSAASRISVTKLEEILGERAEKGQKGKVKAALERKLRDAGVLSQEGIIHVLKAVKA